MSLFFSIYKSKILFQIPDCSLPVKWSSGSRPCNQVWSPSCLHNWVFACLCWSAGSKLCMECQLSPCLLLSGHWSWVWLHVHPGCGCFSGTFHQKESPGYRYCCVWDRNGDSGASSIGGDSNRTSWMEVGVQNLIWDLSWVCFVWSIHVSS